ncbi:hypothetical protein [Dyadobacter jiangsuensis]|uniref:DUF3592 domain-containing protein n=1 Tax=Dyadobacter jiangsuensis TaxID=1591085 RepID=A0A2P8FAP1_9BACT|nr:hypothetical protein [Dyadobacter jiangsuensis]PSL18797.1 hypothetical protein CLV60_12926 [Dyadobacter jiangsuensis]
MNEEIIKEDNAYGWMGFALPGLLGVVIILTTYMMYLDARWKDEMSARAPVVCMKIQYGTRGAGTVKNPDEIYAEYKGKTYHFAMGRKYYRSLLGVDTIAVYYDEASDRAILPTSGEVRHFAPLYIWIGAIGALLTAGSIWQLVKTTRR